MADYSLDLASIADELEVDYNLLIRRFTFGVYSRVMRKSPVDTGRFRGNWILSIDRPVAGTVQTLNKQASVEINGNTQTIDRFALDKNDSIVMQNNLPYSEKLENGHSAQAPNGFLDISIREELEVFK